MLRVIVHTFVLLIAVLAFTAGLWRRHGGRDFGNGDRRDPTAHLPGGRVHIVFLSGSDLEVAA